MERHEQFGKRFNNTVKAKETTFQAIKLRPKVRKCCMHLLRVSLLPQSITSGSERSLGPRRLPRVLDLGTLTACGGRATVNGGNILYHTAGPPPTVTKWGHTGDGAVRFG